MTDNSWEAGGRAFRATTLMAACALGTPDAQAPAAVVPAAAQAQWSAPNADRLRALFSDTRVVRKFLNEIEAGGHASDPGVVAAVSEHRIIDLDGDGWLELVALADVSGRDFFNNVVVVYYRADPAAPKKPLETAYQGFVLRSVTGIDVGGLDSVLNDIDNDGRWEIVLSEPLGPDPGPTQPRVTVREIYEWNGRDYERTSTRHRSYYRNVVLPALERELRKLDAAPAPGKSSERAELRALREKYTREIAEARTRATTQ